jgi:serine/threonine protein kinase
MGSSSSAISTSPRWPKWVWCTLRPAPHVILKKSRLDYASPEVWRDEPYDSKSDVWSLGCVLYEMGALKPPFRAADMDGLFKKVQKGFYDPMPLKYSKDL